MNTVLSTMLEAALRALVAAAVIWSVLRLFRVGNVRTQKAAWTLMLLGAFAMPLLMQWDWLPAADAIHIPPLSRIYASVYSGFRATVFPPDRIAVSLGGAEDAADESPAPPPLAWSAISNVENKSLSDAQKTAYSMGADTRGPLAAPPVEAGPDPIPGNSIPLRAVADAPSPSRLPRLRDLAWFCYLAVAAILLLRMMIGLISALRLWTTGSPVVTTAAGDFMPAGGVRSSPRVSSPANIGPGIVLPADYVEWSDEKLRVVLAHERAHVREGDFYLQLLAGFYAALVWFSPLGWWLKRKLCELGEAMGDRAGLEEAASRSSYAQILLEFAALPRPIGTGVAMASNGHLTSRIERLLDHTTFHNAFDRCGARRATLALIVVCSVLAASAAMVRVQAAGQIFPPAQASNHAQTISVSQESGVSEPSQQTITSDDQDQSGPAPAPAVPPNPDATPNPVPAPLPAGQVPGPAPAPGAAPAPPAPPEPGQVAVPPMPPIHVQLPPIPPIDVRIPPMPNVDVDVNRAMAAEMKALRDGTRADSAVFFANAGEPWALVPAQGEPITSMPSFGFFNNGHRSEFYGSNRAEIDEVRKTAHAPFFWFKHDGKSYVVEDPSVVAQIESIEKPLEDLRSQSRALEQQQREAGEQMRQHMREQRQAPIPKPDLSKQMAELNAAVNSLKSSQGDTITRDQLRNLQRQIVQLQVQVARAESGFYRQNGEWGAEMGAFGKQMGKLGGEQGRLAGEMARMSVSNRGKIDAIIQQSLRDGKAKPVK